MNKAFYKRTGALFIILFCFVITALPVFAHSTNTTVTYGKDTTGWVIFQTSNHAGTLNIKYIFLTQVPSYIATATSTGATRWNSALYTGLNGEITGFSISQAQGTESHIVEISTYNIPNTTYAYTDRGYDYGGYHHIQTNGCANIYVNTYNVTTYNDPSFNADVLAHEFGHIIGLDDLDSGDYYYHDEQLMGYAWQVDGPINGPKLNDKQGACVILGIHTNDEHGSYTYGYLSSTYHRKTCGYCGGYNDFPHTGTAVYYSSTQHKLTCTSCGHTVYQSHNFYVYSNNPYILKCSACGYMYCPN